MLRAHPNSRASLLAPQPRSRSRNIAATSSFCSIASPCTASIGAASIKTSPEIASSLLGKGSVLHFVRGAVSQFARHTCLGILRLYRGLDPGRAEAASAGAVALGALTYKSIASILANGLDRATPPAEAVAVMLRPNLRGPRYFH
ncbi:hypothetical protein MMMDOFMJ_2927 [Methylobacterium gnaphalii]|nr:hypothetical protein MMMDOFMJ_2927 [Methylobacterium gnaphalii]